MTPNLLVDLALAPLAGYLGTKAMEPIGTWLYERESQADRDREEAVRPSPPCRIAAQKSTALIGLDLSEPALDKAALAFHYGVAVSWAPTYALLRRHTSLGPVTAGLASGAARSALVDEELTPALGSSAANRAYPGRHAPSGRRRAPGVRSCRRGRHRSRMGRAPPPPLIPVEPERGERGCRSRPTPTPERRTARDHDRYDTEQGWPSPRIRLQPTGAPA